MESQSPTEMKNCKLPQWFLWPLLLVCLLPTVFFMFMDTYRTGDEIVTYGMANEPEQGWMFSKGRIRAYMDTEIFGDGAGSIPGNLARAAKDVLQNRKNAVFFQMERPAETGWYTGEQLQDYLAITKGESFRPGEIYLNGMGDDANSFLYYLCLHLLSSIAPAISASKWSGFLLNLFCMAASLYLLFRIAQAYVEERGACYLIVAAYACSAAAVCMFTNIRPYALATVMFEMLLLLHLKMLRNLERNGVSAAKKYFKWLVPVYVISYISHYTAGIWAICLAVFTICQAYKQKEFVRSYLLTGILAVILGICADPMSVLGLLSKLKGSEGNGLFTAYGDMFSEWVYGIFGTPLWLLPVGALCGIALYRYRSAERRVFHLEYLFIVLLPVVYMFLSTFLMKSVRICTVMPLFFLLFGLLITYAWGGKKKWKAILFALCFLLWTGGMCAGLIREKKEERKDYLMLEEQLAQYDTDSIVFLRAHGAGYDKIPLLQNYERIYLWTTDEDWQEYAAEAKQALGNDRLVLIDGNPKELWQEAADRWGVSAEQVFGNEQYWLMQVP